MPDFDARYSILCNILDGYITQGAELGARNIYRTAGSSQGDRDQARSRAFIHLFLEAKYGLHEFSAREHQIIDGTGDGGIDAYHLDHDRKVIVLIQSKFRTNAKNFMQKSITIDEISRIDAVRVLKGETADGQGVSYSGRILQLQRDIRNIKDLPLYGHEVVVLANVRSEEKKAVAALLQPLASEIYDFLRCYEHLVVPILRGEQTYFPDFTLNIDMSNKSDGSRLTATVQTRHGPAQVTVILAPTIEIAASMSRYRNSILKFNPRSYLEFSQQSTNAQIRQTIVGRSSGEFALLNNGITLLSDHTVVNDLTAKMDTAHVLVRNPQIINGGQTAFTLSRIFDDTPEVERTAMFADKEVVVRIITLSGLDPDKKLELIQEISSATNSQTQVVAADRLVANDDQREIATRVFLAHGILYEHKRGEYADALRRGVIDREALVERTLFLRLMLLAAGEFNKAARTKATQKGSGFKDMDASDATIARFGCAHAVYRSVVLHSPFSGRRIAETLAIVETVMAAMDAGLMPDTETVGPIAARVLDLWPNISGWCMAQHRNQKWVGRGSKTPHEDAWARSAFAARDIRAYLNAYGLEPASEGLAANLVVAEPA